MKVTVGICMGVLAGALLVSGCSTTPQSEAQQAQLATKTQTAVERAKQADPGLQKFFDTAAGYTVFPSVGKGGVGVGGAYGRGQVFEAGQVVGYSTLTQASIGFQLGGQTYTELIFFEDKAALERFKAGNFAFSAQASAVALKSGVSANAKYTNGVAVFTLGEKGLMYEASIGGQKFSFEPVTTP